MTHATRLEIHECTNSTIDILDFKSAIVDFSFKFKTLIVVTLTQVYLHHQKRWNTPQILELGAFGQLSLILQSGK